MCKSVDYYLSKGCDQASAQYFSQGRKKIITVSPNEDFTLTLLFDNNEHRLYDVKPLIKSGTVFEKFADFDNFKRVYIDDCNCIAWDIDPDVDSNIVWSNKVDLCPDSCYIDSQPISGGGIDA